MNFLISFKIVENLHKYFIYTKLKILEQSIKSILTHATVPVPYDVVPYVNLKFWPNTITVIV